MNDKTILARLRRTWKSQEKDYVIWNQGILPNFISPNGEYNPISFTCYQLYKILQDSFSYQSLYKYLKKYEEIENLLTSKLIINKNNRRERIYSFSEGSLRWGMHTVKYIQDKQEKVKAQKLFELIQEYNHPKKIYNSYIKKKISKDNTIDALQYIIDCGSMFHDHRLETSFLLNALKYLVKVSKKDKKLSSYLGEVVISHEQIELQKKALNYILKYFPDLFNKKFSQFKIQNYPYKPRSLDDYILSDVDFFRFRRFGKSLKQLKDQKLLDFNVKAKEKLKKYRNYSMELAHGDYDPLTNSLVYRWGSIHVSYNEIKNFEQESYENILSADLRSQDNEFWRMRDREFYFSLKIFTTVLNIKEKDVMVAFPSLHTDEGGWKFYKSPIKIFSEKTDFIIYLRR